MAAKYKRKGFRLLEGKLLRASSVGRNRWEVRAGRFVCPGRKGVDVAVVCLHQSAEDGSMDSVRRMSINPDVIVDVLAGLEEYLSTLQAGHVESFWQDSAREHDAGMTSEESKRRARERRAAACA
jgi:hypothetical protein